MNFELLPAPPGTLASTRVVLSRRELRAMLGCVQGLFALSRQPAYRAAILPQVPENGRFDPGHDALMMGYDFHLTAGGPRLIEVNTNAGGLLLPWLPDAGGETLRPLPLRCRGRLLASFQREFALCSGPDRPLRTLAIVDDTPPQQFLYPEMLGFARLLEESGVRVIIADPGELDFDGERLLCRSEGIDLVYNRHTDFYLESDGMAAIRRAYLTKKVCLSPNPFSYALLADKRRLPLWRDREFLRACGLEEGRIGLLAGIVPESRLLSEADLEEVWNSREEWVFKPVNRFGSRGVITGKRISRRRFAEFVPAETLIQRYAAPSLTEIPGEEPMKTDLRLFAYQDRVIAILARLYRGQVTNMHTPGGGFATVEWRENP
jgi:hypothetical protein